MGSASVIYCCVTELCDFKQQAFYLWQSCSLYWARLGGSSAGSPVATLAAAFSVGHPGLGLAKVLEQL